jgi:hypothetical protein
MYCPYCGVETKTDYAFCRSCGKSLLGGEGERTPRSAVSGSPRPSMPPTPLPPKRSRLLLALFIAVPVLVLAAAGVGAYLGLRDSGQEGEVAHIESTETVITTATSLSPSTSTASTLSSPATATTTGDVATSAPPQQTTVTSKKTTTTTAPPTATTIVVGQPHTLFTLVLANSVTRYEDTDPLLKWSGSWDTLNLPDASGGTYHASWGDAAVLIRFQGTGISLVAQKFFSHGIARVTLDSDVYLVDMYSEYSGASQTVWTSPTLPYGIHYLTIETTGTKNPESWNTLINVDAVDVAGTLLE